MIYSILKRVSILFCVLFLFACLANEARADNNFDVNADLSYKVVNATTTAVTQKISIINKKEFVYSPSYSITVHLKNIQGIKIQNATGSIPYTVTEGPNNAKTFILNFPDKTIGIGKTNIFVFSFTSSDFTQKTGSIVSITIPALSGSQDFNEYTIHITSPPGYTNPSIVKPDSSYSQSGNTYTFSKNSILKNGVELIFGSPQIYSFNLTYHLANNNVFPITTEIALPPNTSYQDVLIEDLSPKPVNTHLDTDGNILASYTVPPKTTINAKAQILVRVVNNPHPEDLSVASRALYLRPQKYWETLDPEVKKVASSLHTPEDIFKYVVRTLSYDTKKTAEENTRLGARGALAKPYFAVCLEFTDLFVALARAAGIPARALEGYAYTNDSEDKPLSLFQDVLHAWPEYYDTDKKTWIMVDPTWSNTTGGIDYFKTLDFDHVAFVVNGAQSTYPIPAGGYKTGSDSKDVDVSYVDSSAFTKTKRVSVTSAFSSFTNSNSLEGRLTIQNKGNYELPYYNASISVDGGKPVSVALPKTAPYGSSVLSVSIPLPKGKNVLSLTNITHHITIRGEDGGILVNATIRVFPFSQYLIIGGAILIGLTFILILAFKTRSISVQR